jgi:hypothetical protein
VGIWEDNMRFLVSRTLFEAAKWDFRERGEIIVAIEGRRKC